MGRWLAPIMGLVGLATLVAGVLWAELDRSTTGGVPLVGVGVVLLLAAGALAASVEIASHHRHPLRHR